MSHEKRLARRRESYAKNRDRITARQRELWARKPKEDRIKYSREKHLTNKYGISTDDYNKKLEAQGGVCAICGRESEFKNRPLMVDHNHETGCIRGLLCGHCNLVIGHCFDTKVILRRAIEYLEQWMPVLPDDFDDERSELKEAANGVG